MTMNGRSACSPTSNTVTMFGSPESLAAAQGLAREAARTASSRE